MTANDDKDAERFATQVRAELLASEHDLDAETIARLDTARRAAVALAEEESHGFWHNPAVWGVSGGAAAAVLTVAFVFTIFVPTVLDPDGGLDEIPPLDQEEFVIAQDAELLEELEFVAWMIAMEESGEVPASS